MLYRSILIVIILALLTGCGSSTNTEPTPTIAPTPTMTSRSSDTIKVEVRTLPVAAAERWSPEMFHVQIVVTNLTTEEQKAELLATASEGFEFVIPPQELNQELQNNARTIVQRIELSPRDGNQAAYREVNFAFKQREHILTGIHDFVVQAVIPGRDPLRIPIPFEITEKYLANTPISSATTLPADSTPAPAEPSPAVGCPQGTTSYVVQRGDVLNRIASRNNTTMKQIIEANPGKIPNPNSLRIGLELCIP